MEPIGQLVSSRKSIINFDAVILQMRTLILLLFLASLVCVEQARGGGRRSGGREGRGMLFMLLLLNGF